MYLLINKAVFALVILVYAGPLTAETQHETITVAKEHFAQHQFSEGRGVLLGRLRTPNVSVDEKSSIFSAFADFYCNDVGDYTQGMDYYNKALRLKSDNPAALKQIEYIRSQQNEHRQMDQLLKEMLRKLDSGIQPDELSGLKEKIRSLETFAVSTPDYYRSAEVFYCLGMYYAAGGRELKAIDSFHRVLQVKPGFDFMLPVSRRIELWHSRWVREIITASSTSAFAVMYFLTTLLFYATRPWRWLKLRHIAGVVLLNILLGIMVLAAQKGLAASFAASDAGRIIISQKGTHLYTSMNSPGFKNLAVFMGYAMIGFSLVYIFSLSAATLVKNKIIAATISGMAATVIMVSWVCVYYMRHCDMALENTPDITVSGLFVPSDAMLFPIEGIDPHILTDPEAFPNLDIGHNTNPYLEAWAKEHCPFQETEAKAEE